MKKRIIHTMLRVENLEESVNFYCDALGMVVVRKFENEEESYTLAFLGYAEEESSTVIELTYNHDSRSYTQGDNFGHIAIGVESCEGFCQKVKDNGGRIVREPGPLKGGDEIIAFCEDPDGNKIEVIEKNSHWFN